MNPSSKDEPKMNADLCPDDFEIKVPKDCRLLGKFRKLEDWQKYVKTLTPDGELPDYYLDTKGVPLDERKVTCCTCEGRMAWILKGQEAIAHARNVHEKIHREALGLDQVSAIDVGFAIWEHRSRFENFLSIRIHVNKKQPPEQLVRAGLASLTLPNYVFNEGASLRLRSSPEASGSRGESSEEIRSSCGDNPCKKSGAASWKHLLRIMTEDQSLSQLWRSLSHYPIGGIRKDDLSIFCPQPLNALSTLHDVRLCICGVPIDVINATYRPSIVHPGGDADRGVFVKAPKRGVEQQDDELLLVGRGRVNPLVGGVSIGSVTEQAGTLGTLVWDRTDGTPCILSNWHVLAGTTGARVGQPTYQPARFDGGTENDVVAYLKRWHLGEQGDAALAELASRRHYASGEVLGLWHPISGYLEPELNMEVRKWGRTTGFSQGFVDGIQLATNIDYGGGFVRYFRDQFHIAPLYRGEDVSQVGDSGSLVVTSLKPLELRQNVEKLCRWLRICCDTKAVDVICADMVRKLERWQEKCPKREKCEKCERCSKCGKCTRCERCLLCEECPVCVSCSGCQCCVACGKCTWCEVCKVICGLALPSCCNSDSSGQVPPTCCNPDCGCTGRALEESIEKSTESIRKIREKVEAYLEKAVLCARHLERMLEACRNAGGFSERDFENKIKVALRSLEEIGMAKFDLGPERNISVLIWSRVIDCAAPDPLGQCEKILNCLIQLGKVVEKLGDSLVLCREIEGAFKGWRAQLDRVDDAEGFLLDLCLLLEEELQKGSCKNPAEVIRKIENKLPRLTARNCPDDLLESSGKSVPAGKKSPHKPSDDFEKDFKKKIEDIGLDSYKPGDDWFLEALQQDLEKPSLPAKDWFLKILKKRLSMEELLGAVLEQAKSYLHRQCDQDEREVQRVYYAVGMLFAGDTPGSPFGEFALASDISILERDLRFSLRPIFEPRSSFRELRERPSAEGADPVQGSRARRGRAPGEPGGDPRGGGPQPEGESAQGNPGGG